MLLDCCHSGDFANPGLMKKGPTHLQPSENMTVIASSRDVEDSIEAGGHGVFTGSLLDALNENVADHMGWVTGLRYIPTSSVTSDLLISRPSLKLIQRT